jgi:hypothetical protein
MKCGDCGSRNVALTIHQERDYYEGTITCESCNVSYTEEADSTGELVAILDKKMREGSRTA